MVKFRPSKKALGKTAEGPGADALAAVRASMSAQEEGAARSASGPGEAASRAPCTALRSSLVLPWGAACTACLGELP